MKIVNYFDWHQYHLLFSDILCMARVDHTNGFGQVSENRWVLKIQNGRGVVTQDPGELKRDKTQLQHDASSQCKCIIFHNHGIINILRSSTCCLGKCSALTTGYCDKSL